jgi:hypothetical protein
MQKEPPAFLQRRFVETILRILYCKTMVKDYRLCRVDTVTYMLYITQLPLQRTSTDVDVSLSHGTVR